MDYSPNFDKKRDKFTDRFPCVPRQILYHANYLYTVGTRYNSTKFHFPIYLLTTYLLCLVLGACASLYLYRNKRFYVQNTVLMQTGSKIPLCIMMSNFSIKYCLNVLLSTHSSLYSVLSFNITYGIISGFTVGLFWGGIIKSSQAKARLSA